MDSSLITLLVIVVLLVIAGLALAVYKAGFRAKKVTVKTPVFEAEMERSPSDQPETAATISASPQVGPKISQRATEGGAVTQSGITAPADSSADIDQQAKGQGSKIDDSPIKLT